MAGMRRSGLSRRGTCFLIGGIACLAITLLHWQNSNVATEAPWHRYVSWQPDSAESISFSRSFVAQVEAFCGDCHGMPLAQNYPRDAWHGKVRRAYEYYARSGRNDLHPPPIHQTVAYYRSLAPAQIALPQPPEAQTQMGVKFIPQPFDLDQATDVQPGIAHLRWTDLEQDGNPVLLVCDMRRGYVSALNLRDPDPRPRILGQLDNPCHVESCDLDGDRMVDLVVAELGSFRAGDHNRGQVVWLRRQQTPGNYEKIVIASGLGRVANNQPVDIDGDGDLDVIVAEFGYHKTGKTALLRNTAASGDRPQFELEVLDHRPGASHIQVHDLNRDGRPDFLALISQEYECVTAFLNQGHGQFQQHTIWAAPDPTFGSTSIQLVDLDQDGDIDILYTNGDTFDDQYVKPSHGVQWLENLANSQFACRRLTDLPGAHGARTGDFDRDGDLDVVAVSWLHDQLYPVSAVSGPTASIVYLEQTSPGTFARHTLEVGLPCHAALEVADFDDDGDLDFAVGWQLSPKWRACRNSLSGGTRLWQKRVGLPMNDGLPDFSGRLVFVNFAGGGACLRAVLHPWDSAALPVERGHRGCSPKHGMRGSLPWV